MTKLTIIKPEHMIKILKYLGFEIIRQKGSHIYFKHPDGRSTVVPYHRGEDLGRGLIRKILRDIDVAPEKYERLKQKLHCSI